jgi:hypothetical protein
MEETGVPGENQRPAICHCQTLLHIVVSSTPRHERKCFVFLADYVTSSFIEFFLKE